MKSFTQLLMFLGFIISLIPLIYETKEISLTTALITLALGWFTIAIIPMFTEKKEQGK